MGAHKTEHKTSHENDGDDEISVAGLSGVLADAQTAAAHKTSHQFEGTDEISIAGLSGESATPQPPKAHASDHSDGSDDIQTATDSQKGLASAAQILKLDGISPGATAYTDNNADARVNLLRFNRILEVNTDGNDTTGTGTIGKPYLTIAKALTVAATMTPTAANPVGIRVGPGTFIEDNSLGSIELLDYVHVFGIGDRSETVITGNTVATHLFKSGTTGAGSIGNVTITGITGAGAIDWNAGALNRCHDLIIENCTHGIYCHGAGRIGIALNIAYNNVNYPLYAASGGKIGASMIHTVTCQNGMYAADPDSTIDVEGFYIINGTVCGLVVHSGGVISVKSGYIKDCLVGLRFTSIAGTINFDDASIINSTNYDVDFTNNIGILNTLASRMDCTKVNGTGTITGMIYCTSHLKNESFSDLAMKENISMEALKTVDGRDVSVDGSKLDGIDAGADVTGSNPPQAHNTSHENGGSDEISVAGLSGELADDQPLKEHDNAKHSTNYAPDADVVKKVDFDANTILKADTDDTPAALTVAEQRLVGRITAGNITALTAAEVKTLLGMLHSELGTITSDQHHAKSHDHDSASGAGAIATDQIAKFGDGGTTDYAEIQTDGKFRAYGDGRFLKTIYTLAPNMAVGGTLSFDGSSFGAAVYTLISVTDRPALFRRFDYGNPVERAYVIAQTVLPLDYVAGTDFEVCLAWCSNAITGDVEWQLGIKGVGNDDSYNQTPTYQTPIADTVGGTAYDRVTTSFTISGTGFNPGDCIPLVIMREANVGNDTTSGDAYLAGIGIKYISDKLGADL